MSNNKNEDLGRLTRSLRNRNIPDPEAISKRKVDATRTAGDLNIENSNPEQNMDALNHKIFKNDLILDCIFGFSKVEDIKRFRQVCRQWNRVAISSLKNLSSLTFRRPYYSLRRFKQQFKNSQMGTEFTSVKLRTHDGNIQLNWKLSDFTELLQDRRSSIKELVIEDLYIRGVRLYSLSEYFDVSPYIEPGLAKLNIHTLCSSRLTISAGRCISTKFLSLRGCCLKVASGIKINPVGLTLEDVIIRLNENEIAQDSWLTEFVNLDRLEYLSLKTVWFNDGDNKKYLSVYSSNPITLKRLHLNGISINFETGEWKITEKLSLIGVSFTKANQMEVSNLEFEGALLDLAVLPTNLKRLKISDVNCNLVTRVQCSNPINLPQLEILHLKVAKPFLRPGLKMQCISHFNNCSNLTTVFLSFHKLQGTHPCKLDVSLLPKSVQKLYIHGNVGFFGEVSRFQLQQLHVKENDTYSLITILKRFRGEKLAVDLRHSNSTRSAKVFQTVMDISETPFDKVVVAFSYDDKNAKFKDSRLSKCTDKLSQFYIFVNKFGKAISESQFEDDFEFGENITKQSTN